MKKIVLSLLVIVAFVITSCEKEVEKVVEPEKDLRTFVQATYGAFSCYVNTGENQGYGIKCVRGYSSCRCQGPMPCLVLWDVNGTPQFGIYQPMDEYFTTDEINAWTEGNVFESSMEFISDHYDFFLATYEDSITIHPDDMLGLF